VAYQCRERRADPVEQKESANYCEYFEFAARQFVPQANVNPRESSARDALKRLLGD
jgi:hypothetical protein